MDSILPPPFAWCEIPAGPVTLEIGGYVRTGRQTFEVPAFAIAKYPITNAQFRLFVDAGGYKQPRWWTPQGWQERKRGWGWINGAWRVTRRVWKQPRLWDDPDWNGDEYPVVGISWHEALAFCAWLEEVSTGAPLAAQGVPRHILLPTDKQWQRAAQALPDGTDSGYSYPWGSTFDPTCCNTPESGIGKTSPVSQFEGKGDSPCGVVDLIGNVWEWCLTHYSLGTEDPGNGANARVIRGGAWMNNFNNNARAGRQNSDDPNDWGDSLGFRIVRVT